MSKEPKFKVGDFVCHKATGGSFPKKMIVMSVGYLKDEDGETIIYQVSGEKESYFAKDDLFFRAILSEIELKLCDK